MAETSSEDKDQVIGLGTRLALILTPWLTALALAGLTPVLPHIVDDFSSLAGGEALVRLLVTIIGGAAIIGAPSAGSLATRLGSHRVLVFALAIYAIAGTLGAFLDDLWLLLGTRAILGLAVGAISVTGIAMITTAIEPAGRDRWLGYYTVSGTIGAFIILPLSAAIGGRDWHYVFYLHLFALPLFALLALRMSSPARLGRSAPETGGGKGSFPFLWTLIGIGCGIASGTLGVYVPFHLAEIGEVRPDRVAVALLPLNILMGATAFLYGPIRQRFAVFQVFVACFLIGAMGIGIVVFSGKVTLVALGTAVCGIGMGLMTPNLFGGAAASVTPEHRARTLGFVRAGFLGGPLLAQLLLEPIASLYGPTVSLASIMMFSVLMACAVLIKRRSLSLPSPIGTA